MTSYCVVSADEKRHAAIVNTREALFESMDWELVAEAIEQYDSAWIIEQAAALSVGLITAEQFVNEIEQHVTEARNAYVEKVHAMV